MPHSNTLDFVVIGAFKCGTTSLFEYLRRHPEIYMPPGKEIPYFGRDAQRVWSGWQVYLDDVFAGAPPHTLRGTATPQYMSGAELDVPRRLRAAAPDAKLVAILRDPVERARSHHRMEVMLGRETRCFDRAIAELLAPRSLEAARRRPTRPSCYVVYGEYGRILGGFLDAFPRQQLLVLFTEELERSPQAVMRRTLEFLGADAGFVPPDLGTHHARGASGRRVPWLDLSRVHEAAARNGPLRCAWRALPAELRRAVLRRDRALRHRLFLWNRLEGPDDQPEPRPATIEALADHFAQDRRRLSQILGHEPPWRSGSAPPRAEEGGDDRRVDLQSPVDQ